MICAIRSCITNNILPEVGPLWWLWPETFCCWGFSLSGTFPDTALDVRGGGFGLLTEIGEGGRSLKRKMLSVLIPRVLSFMRITMVIIYLRELSLKHKYIKFAYL